MMQQPESIQQDTSNTLNQEVFGKISQAYVDHVLTRNVTPDEMPETSSE